MENRFANKKVAIIGLGIEGKDAIKYLHSCGAEITILDKKIETEMDFSGLENYRFNFIGGENYLSSLSSFDIVVRSPGIYRLLPEILKAESSGVEITSTIKIFFDEFKGKIIGVTGTKGKGTTSTLIFNILKKDGRDAYLAGNIGSPVLEILSQTDANSWVVLELSSFQLMDLHKSPHIAVVLNVTVDHLDWHKSKEEYVEAKTNIVSHQVENDYAVVNFDYDSSMQFTKKTLSQIYYFSRKSEVKGCYVNSEKQIILNTHDVKTVIGNAENLLLRGEHNWENVTAAVCATSLAKASEQSIKTAVFEFKGLEHRLELVGQVNGVTYYNDSFSTNPQTTIAAINAFTEPMILILGGSDKGLDYKELAKEIAISKSVKAIILIGQIANQIESEIKSLGYTGTIKNLGMTTMRDIIKTTQDIGTNGDVAVLSPATASFGMFKDYKDRGQQFKLEVGMLVK